MVGRHRTCTRVAAIAVTLLGLGAGGGCSGASGTIADRRATHRHDDAEPRRRAGAVRSARGRTSPTATSTASTRTCCRSTPTSPAGTPTADPHRSSSTCTAAGSCGATRPTGSATRSGCSPTRDGPSSASTTACPRRRPPPIVPTPIRYPIHEQDVAAAVGWVKDHAGELGGDPTPDPTRRPLVGRVPRVAPVDRPLLPRRRGRDDREPALHGLPGHRVRRRPPGRPGRQPGAALPQRVRRRPRGLDPGVADRAHRRRGEPAPLPRRHPRSRPPGRAGRGLRRRARGRRHRRHAPRRVTDDARGDQRRGRGSRRHDRDAGGHGLPAVVRDDRRLPRR